MPVQQFAPGGYRFLNHAFQYSGGVAAEPGWEIAAPHPLSVVCYRFVPPGRDDAAVDVLNAAIMEDVNADGRIFISSTKLRGRTVLRLAIGNERTTRADVVLAWQIIRDAASLGARDSLK